MAASFILEGTIDQIGKTETRSSFSLRKFRIAVPEADPRYVQHPEFQLENASCPVLDNFFVGSNVRVSFNITGRQWTNPKTGVVVNFTTLKAWKVESLGAAEIASSARSSQIPAFNDKSDEDAPF